MSHQNDGQRQRPLTALGAAFAEAQERAREEGLSGALPPAYRPAYDPAFDAPTLPPRQPQGCHQPEYQPEYQRGYQPQPVRPLSVPEQLARAIDAAINRSNCYTAYAETPGGNEWMTVYRKAHGAGFVIRMGKRNQPPYEFQRHPTLDVLCRAHCSVMPAPSRWQPHYQ